MNKLSCFYEKIFRIYSQSNSSRFVKYLKKNNIKIGSNVVFRCPRNTLIDLTRPSLIEIGNNVDINDYFTVLTHDYTTHVFINLYNEFLPSSGKVKIGNNVYFGRNVTLLKGAEIGDNSIVGVGSLVTKSMPSNSVIIGAPAKVFCTIDEYFEKRKLESLIETREYIKSIREQGREPLPEDFWEEFGFFVDSQNINEYPMIPIRRQLNDHYKLWLLNHKKQFKDIQDFIDYDI